MANIMRQAVVIKDGELLCVIVIPAGEEGDAYLSNYDGIITVPDPDDGYGVDFITYSGCSIVEITGMLPMPGVGNGWVYSDGVFIPPKPYASWFWDGENWVAPKPKPEGDYFWSEPSGQWEVAV